MCKKCTYCEWGQDSYNNSSKVSKETAENLAEAEYNKFRLVQGRRFESGFDREVKRLRDNSPKMKSPG